MAVEYRTYWSQMREGMQVTRLVIGLPMLVFRACWVVAILFGNSKDGIF